MRDYGRDMYRQLCEQTEKAERLECENRQLRQENRRLRNKVESLEARLERMETEMNTRIEASVNKTIAPLQKELIDKDAQIQKANDEILRLKINKDKDSGNSSKPPSSNGLKKVSNNRESTGRKPGGQPGHKGHGIRIPKNLHELAKAGKVVHKVLDETNGACTYTSDWEISIQVIPIFTEIRRAVGTPPRIQYGVEMQALSVYLQNVGMISQERLADFFRDATGGLISPSEATLERFNQMAADNVDLSSLEADLLNGPVLYTDDTPVRTTERLSLGQTEPERSVHTTLNAHIRTYSNGTTTLLTVNAHKGMDGIEHDNILPRYIGGILAHDHEAKFYNYGILHATCGAHLIRELKGINDLWMQPWAGQMRSLFLEMNEHKLRDLAAGNTSCDPLVLQQFELRFDQLIAEGIAHYCSASEMTLGLNEVRKMTNRLKEYKDCYLLFLRNYLAPFTNNQSERDLRHCKTRQKVSGCFRSWRGIQDYCNIRSLIDTTRKRGADIFAAIRSCLRSTGHSCPTGQ